MSPPAKKKPPKGKQKGIRDPWRPGSRMEEEQEEHDSTMGTSESNHPLDWDLAPERKVMLKHPGVSGWLMVKGADEVEGAARTIMVAIQRYPRLAEQLEKYGFSHGPLKEHNVSGFIMADSSYTLYMPTAQNEAEGFRRFLQVLLYGSNALPGFRTAIEELGLFPVLA